jgi:hypothetical protein
VSKEGYFYEKLGEKGFWQGFSFNLRGGAGPIFSKFLHTNNPKSGGNSPGRKINRPVTGNLNPFPGDDVARQRGVSSFFAYRENGFLRPPPTEAVRKSVSLRPCF